MSGINGISSQGYQTYGKAISSTSASSVAQDELEILGQSKDEDQGLLVSDQISISGAGIQALQQSASTQREPGPLNTLAANGTITIEQRDAIKAALLPPEIEGSGKQNDEILLGLVKDGVITEDQRLALDAAIKSDPSKKQEGGKPPHQPGPLGELVKSGTITSDQRELIKSAMEAARDGSSSRNDVLNGLVEDGSITADQQAALIQALQEFASKGIAK